MIAEAGLPVAGAAPVLDPRGERLRHARDWSFSHTRFAGPGWALAGDAACFVDPILSGGVDFAIRGAMNAALAAARAIEAGPAAAAAHTEAYEQRLKREYRAYLRLARYWYGNNRSVSGLFWTAHRAIPPESVSTPLRAFVYLTSGQYAADAHMKVFQEWQEQKIFRALGVEAGMVREAARKLTRQGAPGGPERA